MNKEIAEKMMNLLSTKEKSNEDIRFIVNHLDGFATFMLDMATFHFVKDGVPAEKVNDILGPLVEVHKLLGVTEYNDFVKVGQMFDEEGL